jgi:phosphoribosylformylglycinamidine (FGAM) synthase PurS component
VNKSGFEKSVKSIRAGKYLRVDVEATDGEDAKRIVERMCNELRMFNPAAHTLTVEVGRIAV